MIDRREILAGAALAGVSLGLPALASAATATCADPRLRAVVDRLADEMLALSPTTATTLGLDKGARTPLRAQLDDYSPAADARAAAHILLDFHRGR